MNRRESAYYRRRRPGMLKESRGVNTAEVFANRLGNLCDGLDNLQDDEMETMVSDTLLVNMSKEARLLADMYEKDDVFIDEVAGTPGFTAERNFGNDALNTLDLDFPDALRMVSDCIEDILDDDCDEEELSVLSAYIELIGKFLVQLRKDYSI